MEAAETPAGFDIGAGLEDAGEGSSSIALGPSLEVVCEGVAGFCAWPSEALMIDAADLGPPSAGSRLAVDADGLRVGSSATTGVAGFAVAASVTAAGSGADSTSGPLTSAAAAPPFRLLGPLALPFRISSSGAPGAGGSLGEAIGGERILSRSAGLSGLEPLGLPAAGGPRASMLARPGLKRLASLLVSFAAGGGETTRFSGCNGARLSSTGCGLTTRAATGSACFSSA